MGVNSVAVLGAGHGGCAAAADLGKRGYCVRLHARNPDRLAPLRARGGIEARGIVQVSMNLTNYEVTPIQRAFDAVKREAARHGVNVLESEIVGLVPSAALSGTSAVDLQLVGFTRDKVLENRLRGL